VTAADEFSATSEFFHSARQRQFVFSLPRGGEVSFQKSKILLEKRVF